MTQPLATAESTLHQPQAFPDFNPPAALGVLYSKTWKAPFVNGVTDEWTQRVAGYWERIEQKYGLIMSQPAIDYLDETGTITTFATVLAIVPGERYRVEDVQ